MSGGMKSGTGLFMQPDAYRKFTPEEEAKFKNKFIMDPATTAATTKKKKKPTDTIAAATKLTG